MKQKVYNVFIFIIVSGLSIIEYFDHFHNKESPDMKEAEEIVIEELSFLNKTPEEGLMEALIYYDVKHPDIVYAQAILETGHFKSENCKKGNNLFGLYNSKKGRYYRYGHWSESVKAYKTHIQHRYISPSDYYKFLKDIGYAEDPMYIDKVKGIVNRNKNDKKGSK